MFIVTYMRKSMLIVPSLMKDCEWSHMADDFDLRICIVTEILVRRERLELDCVQGLVIIYSDDRNRPSRNMGSF